MTKHITQKEADRLDQRIEGLKQRLDRIAGMLEGYLNRAPHAEAARRASLYRAPDGERVYEHIGRVRREDAEKALTQRLRELDAGVWRPPSTETVEQYGRRWLELRNPARITVGERPHTPLPHGGRTANRI